MLLGHGVWHIWLAFDQWLLNWIYFVALKCVLFLCLLCIPVCWGLVNLLCRSETDYFRVAHAVSHRLLTPLSCFLQATLSIFHLSLSKICFILSKDCYHLFNGVIWQGLPAPIGYYFEPGFGVFHVFGSTFNSRAGSGLPRRASRFTLGSSAQPDSPTLIYLLT